MSEDELLVFRTKCSRGHILFSTLFCLFTVVQLLSHNSSYGMLALGYAALFLAIDVSVSHFRMSKKRIAWCWVRGIELVMATLGLLGSIVRLTSVFMAIMLSICLLELIVEHDICDLYTRYIVIIVSAIPAGGFMILNLMFHPGDQNEFYGLLCSYLTILVFVFVLAEIIEYIINASDKKVFSLRRLAESTKRTNEDLRIQQEKVKMANEELGIQKIKLEAAYHKINNANAETTIQNLILTYISSSIEIKTLLSLITESILEALALDVCAVILQPQIAGNRTAMCQIRTRIGKEFESNMKESMEQGSLNAYMKAEGNFVDNHVPANVYPFLSGNAIKSLLIVPLVREDAVIGALLCGRTMPEFFHENILFFESVVVQLQVAIHNASLYAKMQQMAIRDSLTGIYNRGHLNVMLDEYSKEAIETNSPLTAALFDIDRFKEVNDTYGHLFGDQVIKAITSILQDSANENKGIAARYGGEEFVLILPHHGMTESVRIIQDVKRRIDAIQLSWEGELVTTKVSVGITSYPQTCPQVTALLNRADNAMYYSKNHGRDQITIDSEEVSAYIKNQAD